MSWLRLQPWTLAHGNDVNRTDLMAVSTRTFHRRRRFSPFVRIGFQSLRSLGLSQLDFPELEVRVL